jgi:hypothetical protein
MLQWLLQKQHPKHLQITNFIKGIGNLGIVSDRIAESVTPLKQLGEVLPGILSSGIGSLTGAIEKLTSVVKDPYALGAETAESKPLADTYQVPAPEHQIQYQPDYLTANMLLMLQLQEETNHC